MSKKINKKLITKYQEHSDYIKELESENTQLKVKLNETHIRDEDRWWTRFFLDQEHLENIISKFVPGRSKDFLNAIQSKDRDKLIQIMNEVWLIKFDKPSKFFISGWGTLCDLCADEDI